MKAIQRAESGEAPWIEERGERHGNSRRMEAHLKVVKRRNKRAIDKVKVDKEIRES